MTLPTELLPRLLQNLHYGRFWQATQGTAHLRTRHRLKGRVGLEGAGFEPA